MNIFSKTILSICCTTLLISCGSDDMPDEEQATTPNVGVFIDSPVAGIEYSTDSYSGKTDEAGRFSFNDGETVQFSIGDIVLPGIKAESMVHVSDIFSGTTADQEVINLARLLLTLDTDNNPENGITIGTAAFTAATGITLDFSSTTFEADVANYITEAGGTSTLIAQDIAKTHIEATLVEAKNYTTEEEDALLFPCGNDCVSRASYHEHVSNFYPRHQQVNVAVDTKIELTIATEALNVPGEFQVELFPIKENADDCRIDYGGIACGNNTAGNTDANWVNIINGQEFLDGTVGETPVIFGTSGAQVDVNNKVTLSLEHTLKPKTTYLVHVFNDDFEGFKTWWLFKTN